MKKLRIKALCIHLGSAESLKAASLIVWWTGKKPFEDARLAIDDFIQACRKQCQAPEPQSAACCRDTLARNPKAKACEACGRSTRKETRKNYPLDEYFRELLAMDCDGFGDAAYPAFEYDGSDTGDCKIGNWDFFRGFPIDCDVVEIDQFDRPFSEYGSDAARYRVIHVGKIATRASSKGTLSCQ